MLCADRDYVACILQHVVWSGLSDLVHESIYILHNDNNRQTCFVTFQEFDLRSESCNHGCWAAGHALARGQEQLDAPTSWIFSSNVSQQVGPARGNAVWILAG